MADKLPIEIAGTFDLESANWTRFALGVCYDGVRARHWWGAPEPEPGDADAGLPASLVSPGDDQRGGEPGGLDGMIDYLRARGGIWIGHGAGVYDNLAILERCRARGIACQVDRSAHRVTRVVIGKLTLRDSYGLWPVPLDEICGSLRRKVPRLPWACTCHQRGCAGYCQIGERARAGDPDLLDYCTADCVDLYDGFHGLRDFATKHRIRLRGTLAQTSWNAAQDELGVPDSDLPWHLWRAIRKADKGGRTCIVRPRAKGAITHWDICNAYPAQLAKAELPVGSIRELSGDAAAYALDRCHPGVYTVTVHVPEDLFIPPLPWHYAGQLFFPTGELSGTWCLPELIAAFERGVTVVSVHSAVTWESTAPIFGPLVERWYEIRRAVGRKTPYGQWIGRAAKALTGKLAERPERNRVLMHPEAIKICLRIGACRQHCSGRCGAYEQLDLKGEIFAVPYQKLGGSAYPQWSAYLRAGTRVQWLEQAERQGRDLVLGNTDSIWTLGRDVPRPTGDGLGEWEYQDSWADLDIRSHSTYAGHRLPDGQRLVVDRSHNAPKAELASVPGEFVVRGIPYATEDDWKRGAGLIDRGVVTFQRAARGTRGLWTKKARKWTLPHVDRAIWGDRELHADGVTYPMPAGKIREQIEQQRARRNRLAKIAQGIPIGKRERVA